MDSLDEREVPVLTCIADNYPRSCLLSSKWRRENDINYEIVEDLLRRLEKQGYIVNIGRTGAQEGHDRFVKLTAKGNKVLSDSTTEIPGD